MTGKSVATVAFDLDSLTLGEMMAAEDASGRDITELVRRSASRRILAVFVHQLRTSGQPPSWRSLSDLKLLDALPSDSGSSQDGESMGSSPLDKGISPTS